MIGSPRPPMYSPPTTWGAPLLQMSLPQNKTMGEKSGLTLGSLVTAAGRAFMQELNRRGLVRQHSFETKTLMMKGEARIGAADKEIGERIARGVRTSYTVCAHSKDTLHSVRAIHGVHAGWQRRGQWYPCIRRYRIALRRLPSHIVG